MTGIAGGRTSAITPSISPGWRLKNNGNLQYMLITTAVLVLYVGWFLFAEKRKGWLHLHVSSVFEQKGGHGLLWNCINLLFCSLG